MANIEYKYTKSGKKVAVLGKLNTQQWIVQEIFISNGQELPGGESFIETTLLDKPAETWQDANNKSLKESEARLKETIKKLEEKVEVLKRKATVGKLINHATAMYENIDVGQLDILFAFMSGEITHVILEEYGGWRIESLTEAIEDKDCIGYHIRTDGLKLVSLFGCDSDGKRYENDYSFRLDWRINQYRDGSGSCWYEIYPCKSYEDAIAKLDELVATKEKANEKLIALKEKYGLQNPSAEKIAAYRQSCVESMKETIAKKESELGELRNKLGEMAK